MIGGNLIKQAVISMRNATEEEFQDTVSFFLQRRRIFITGAGRSALVGKFFGISLMHLGSEVYVVGETNTPSIAEGDVLVAISASGNTGSVVYTAESAKNKNALVVAVTANRTSALFDLSDRQIVIDSRNTQEREDQNETEYSRKIPVETSFELSSLIYFEAITSEIMQICSIDEAYMQNKRANI